MKFIHIADVHLGMTPDKGKPWSEERRRELMSSFADIISICGREKTDLLLIAGDLFHQQPLVRELKEVSALFDTIPGTRVVLIAGNHDYISGVSHYNTFEWGQNVTFFSKNEVESVYFEDIGAEVYGFSFEAREIHEAKCDDLHPADRTHVNILVAHGGEPDNLPINGAALAESGFDYVALGHIHKPGSLSDHVRYPGSLEPLDRNETGEHGYIRGTIDKGQDGTALVTTEFVPHAVREYFKLNIEVDGTSTSVTVRDVLAQRIAESGAGNIYTVTLTGYRDPDITFDPAVITAELNIAEFFDRTEPDYDFEALGAENRDNLIGIYIDRIKRAGGDPEILRKALYYGVEALLR